MENRHNNKIIRAVVIVTVMLVIVIAAALFIWSANGSWALGAADSDSKTETEIDYSDFPDPATSTIAVMVGTTDEILGTKRYPDATFLKFDSMNECIMAVITGKADYALNAELDTYNYMNHNPGKIIIVQTKVDNENLAIAVRKSSPQLLSDVNRVISQFKEDGTLKKIENNWVRHDGSDYIQEEVPVRENGEVLHVAVFAQLEPMCFIENGEVTGFDAELIQRIAYELGMRVEFDDMKFIALIPALMSEKDDLAISEISITEERKKSVDFSISYYENQHVLLAKNPSYSEASAWSLSDAFKDISDSFYNNFILENRWKMMLSGIGCTLIISVFSGIIGYAIGLLFCIMRIRGCKVIRKIIVAVTRVFQGTPMVVVLMIFYYIILSKTGLNGISVAIIAFALNFGAYSSEIMLSGINAVDKGQSEAALSIGFTPAQTFSMIVFPQAAGHFLPVLKGELISLVKSTSIVGYIAVQDLTKVSDIIRSRTYEAFFPLIISAIIYFLLSFGLSILLNIVATRIEPEHRSRKLKLICLTSAAVMRTAQTGLWD